MIPEMVFNNDGGDLSPFDPNESVNGSNYHNGSGNPLNNDGMAPPLLHQHLPPRRPSGSSHGQGPRKLSYNSNHCSKNEYIGGSHNNNDMPMSNGGTADYNPHPSQHPHSNNNYHHELPQSLRRLSGQGSGFRQSNLDATGMPSDQHRGSRHYQNGHRLSHRDSYPNEEEYLLNDHHTSKQHFHQHSLLHHQHHGGSHSREETVMNHLEEEPKHPLEHSWCLFMLQDAERRTQESWKESQVEVHEFITVEDFWCMVNHIHPPSHIGVSDYSLFKKGIKPAWEDPGVSQGGRWVAKLPVKLRTIDDIWLHVNMAMIGESLFGEKSDHICGAVVSIRPRSLKMSLWINCRDPQSTFQIGTEFQIILQTHLEQKDKKTLELSFQSFKDSIEYRLTPAGVFTSGESHLHQQPGATYAQQVIAPSSGISASTWDAPPAFQGHQQGHQQESYHHDDTGDVNGEVPWTDTVLMNPIEFNNDAVDDDKDPNLSATTSTISTIHDEHHVDMDLIISDTNEQSTTIKRTPPLDENQ